MANMIPISTIVVGSTPASNINFISIPQNYTDLMLRISARNNDAVGQLSLYIWFNSDRSNTYIYKTLQGSGTATSSNNYTNTAIDIGQLNGSTSTANTFNNAEVYIPNYTALINKSINTDTVQENNSSTAYVDFHIGLFPSTSPINQISLSSLSAGSFVQYSSATLYGISRY